MELSSVFPQETFKPVDAAFHEAAIRHLDMLTKPRGSLGVLEDMAARLFCIASGKLPLKIDPCLMLTCAGDHGVACRNVSPFLQAVTRQMVENFLAGGAAINALSHAEGIDMLIVDAGCAGSAFAPHPKLLDRRLGAGTADFCAGPAMSLETCVAGLRNGLEVASGFVRQGYRCLALGEMGIANSTAAAALYCAFLNLAPDQAAGPGAGALGPMIERKREVVGQALRVNADAVQSGDPLRILAALGGFEIVTLTGMMLGCVARQIPFVVDGFICSAAYVAALAFLPFAKNYAFLAHASAEPGFAHVMKKLDSTPILSLGLRLGEGTGAALAVPILRGAAAIYNEMATFEEASVSATEADRIN